MRKLVLLLLIAAIALPLSAQTGRSKGKKKKKTRTEITKRPEQSSEFLDRLWVGGNLSDFSFFGESFRLGLTPVAMYEVNRVVNIGPMVRMAYRFQRVYDFQNNRYNYSTFDVGPGVFGRFNIAGQFFAHVEFEAAFLEQPLINDFGNLIIQDGKVVTVREQQNYVYLGVGYVSGSPKSQFITSLHYNVLDDINYVRFPWDFRVGMRFRIGDPPLEQPDNRRR